jgi:hypothetical protein
MEIYNKQTNKQTLIEWGRNITKTQLGYKHHKALDFGGQQSYASTHMINFNRKFICNNNWKLDNGIQKEE